MSNTDHRAWNKRQKPLKNNTKHNPVNDDEVMISTSIKDLEAMMGSVDTHTTTKFEKMFLPALIVFGLLAFGGFLVIYSITTDMTRLANAMDPKMGSHMEEMSVSIQNLDKNIAKLTLNIHNMDKNFTEVNHKMGKVVAKLDNLDSIASDISIVKNEMRSMKPMLNNMNHMNQSMLKMQKSMNKLDKEISSMSSSIKKPTNMINSIPFF